MPTTNQQLYVFLSACSGNWRNTLHIINPQQGRTGHLLAFDRDGLPVLMVVNQLQQLSGEQIDPAECCGQLTREGFQSLYAQYLLWHTVSDAEDPLSLLSQDALGHP